MTKERKDVLDKLDRVVLFLTWERLDAKTQLDWQNYLDASLTVRQVRREVAEA